MNNTIITKKYGNYELSVTTDCSEDLLRILSTAKISISADEEAIYRKKEREYLLEDARNHISDYLEEDEDEDYEDEDLLKKTSFLQSNIDELVDSFIDRKDCNIADNDLWQTIIQNKLAEM